MKQLLLKHFNTSKCYAANGWPLLNIYLKISSYLLWGDKLEFPEDLDPLADPKES